MGLTDDQLAMRQEILAHIDGWIEEEHETITFTIEEVTEAIVPALTKWPEFDTLEEVERQRNANARVFLNRVASEHRECSKCGREIWLVLHPKTGKSGPYTEELVSHFVDCGGRNG